MKVNDVIPVLTTCTLCNKSFAEGEVAFAKLPEGCYFCESCMYGIEDDNIYEGRETWIAFEYTKGMEFVWE